MKRVVETHGYVQGLAIESVAYPDGRAFVVLGERLLSMEAAQDLVKCLQLALVAAGLGPSLQAVAEVKP